MEGFSLGRTSNRASLSAHFSSFGKFQLKILGHLKRVLLAFPFSLIKRYCVCSLKYWTVSLRGRKPRFINYKRRFIVYKMSIKLFSHYGLRIVKVCAVKIYSKGNFESISHRGACRFVFLWLTYINICYSNVSNRFWN